LFSRNIFLLLFVAASFMTMLGSSQAQSPDKRADPIKELILEGETFLVDDRPAFILWPSKEKRSTPQPWVMYSPTLPRYPDVHERWMHQQFLDAGVAVAGIDVGESYGSPEGRKHFSALYKELTTKRNFGAKPCLLGRSRGGLWSSSWAIRNTNKVAGIAGIYPVFDLTTYPGMKRAAPAYKMPEEDLAAAIKQHNPIEKVGTLAKAKIPIFIIHGDIDNVVPLKQNAARLVEIYNAFNAQGLVELEVVKGQGHNFFEGFFTSQKLVDFTIKQSKSGAKATPPRKLVPAPEGVEVLRDITFSTVDEQELQLDLYRPKKASGMLPVVVWVHGGGWKNGSKDRCPAAWLAAHGFTVASINYRLTHEAQWPAQIDDCRAAVRWLRENAKTLNLNPDRIGAWGSSAGGHLVALLGTLDPPDSEGTSSQVQAVCDWFGPTDLLTMPPNTISETRTEADIAQSNGAKLLGATVRDVPALAKQASALCQVSEDDPPFLIMHGEKDPGVPLSQSQRLHEKLLTAGAQSELKVIANAGHGGKEFQAPEAKQLVLDFFSKTLKDQ
jgi:acetyl esterase/lipase